MAPAVCSSKVSLFIGVGFDECRTGESNRRFRACLWSCKGGGKEGPFRRGKKPPRRAPERGLCGAAPQNEAWRSCASERGFAVLRLGVRRWGAGPRDEAGVSRSGVPEDGPVPGPASRRGRFSFRLRGTGAVFSRKASAQARLRFCAGRGSGRFLPEGAFLPLGGSRYRPGRFRVRTGSLLFRKGVALVPGGRGPVLPRKGRFLPEGSGSGRKAASVPQRGAGLAGRVYSAGASAPLV